MKFRILELKEQIQHLLNPYIFILKEDRNRKYLAISLLIISIITILQIGKIFFLQPDFVTDKNGNLIAIERPSRKEVKEIPLIAEIKKGKQVSRIPVDIKVSNKDLLREKEKSKKTDVNKPEQIREAAKKEEDLRINRNIQKELKGADENNRKNYILPKKLKDGENVRWSFNKETKFPKALMLFPLAPIVIIMLSKSEKIRLKKEETDALRWAIPNFTHQFVLYLNSGLIVTDILGRLCKRYEKLDKKNPLEEMVIQAQENSKLIHAAPIISLQKLAEKTAVSEFMRIVAIISDSQIKGVDIRNKLENESKILWHDRKKAAEEKGHIAESKLAFPLSILLIVLMLITAAPAMMEL